MRKNHVMRYSSLGNKFVAHTHRKQKVDVWDVFFILNSSIARENFHEMQVVLGEDTEDGFAMDFATHSCACLLGCALKRALSNAV